MLESRKNISSNIFDELDYKISSKASNNLLSISLAIQVNMLVEDIFIIILRTKLEFLPMLFWSNSYSTNQSGLSYIFWHIVFGFRCEFDIMKTVCSRHI